MGANIFSLYVHGTDLAAAYDEAHADSAYKSGGLYSGDLGSMSGRPTALRQNPVLPHQAEAIARDVIDRDVIGQPDTDDYNTDRLQMEKGSTVYAIPVSLPTRTVHLTGLTGTVEKHEDAARDEMTSGKYLRRGESIESIWCGVRTLASDRYGTRRTPQDPFTDGTATVTVRKADAPTTRTVKVNVTILGDPGHDEQQKVRTGALAAVQAKIRAGEQVRSVTPDQPSWDQTTRTQTGGRTRTHKTEVAAGKAKPVTKYVVHGSTAHRTWETGFTTQAQARAHAVALADAGATPNAQTTTYTVEGVVRRDNAEPLVTVTRKLIRTVHPVTVELVTDHRTNPTVDAWFLFGLAPS